MRPNARASAARSSVLSRPVRYATNLTAWVRSAPNIFTLASQRRSKRLMQLRSGFPLAQHFRHPRARKRHLTGGWSETSRVWKALLESRQRFLLEVYAREAA
jgi:hypothetical protein